MSMKVHIVSKTDCPYCKKVKEFLAKNDVTFTDEVFDDADRRKKFYAEHGVNSVPQVFIDGVRIGGYTELMERWPTIASEAATLTTYSRVYKPFAYPWAVELAKKHENVHWTEDELDLSEDVMDWKSGRMSEADKGFVKQVLRLFTQSDVSVATNYCDLFIPVFKNNEIRGMLRTFSGREDVHQRAYDLLNSTLGFPDSEHFQFMQYKQMLDKVEFIEGGKNGNARSIALALARSVFSEGVILFASFVMLLNYQRTGLMKGMGKVVEWSIRDETMHVEGLSRLFRAYCDEHPRIVDDAFKAEIYEDVAKRVVHLEDRFVDLAYREGGPANLPASEVKGYVRYIADRRLIQCGLRPIFRAKENPIPWLEWVLNGVDHTNFFENRVTEYDVAGMKGEYDYEWIESLPERRAAPTVS